MLNSKTAVFLFIFGYQCYAPILAILGVESSAFSAACRVLILIYGACVIFKSRDIKISIEEGLLVLFIAAVSYKLFKESFLLGAIDPKFFQVHLLTVLLPCIIMSILPNPVGSILDGKLLSFGCFALLLNVLVAIFELLSDPLRILSGRLEHANLNANSLGLFACCIALAALHQKRRLLFAAAAPWLLGANSRQSLVAFGVGLLSFVRFRAFGSVRSSVYAFLLVGALGAFYLTFIMKTEFDVVLRMASVTSASELSVTSRIEGIKAALDQFSGSPIMGSTLNNGMGGFPHNIILETLTGFGALVSLLLITLILVATRRSRTNKINRSILLVYLVSSMFSGGLYAYNELFVLMMVAFKKKHSPNVGLISPGVDRKNVSLPLYRE